MQHSHQIRMDPFGFPSRASISSRTRTACARRWFSHRTSSRANVESMGYPQGSKRRAILGYKTIEWNREKLYQEIWARPTRSVAHEYGLSDVGLAKICKKLKIPRPGLGYWRRKETGKAVPPPPALPTLKQPIKLVSYISDGPKAVAKEPGSAPDTPAIVVTVGGLLTDPHPLVLEAKQNLATRQPD